VELYCFIDEVVIKTVKVTIKTQNKKPTISFDLKSSTFNKALYENYDSRTDIGTTLTVIDKSTKKPLEAEGLTVRFDSSKSNKMASFSPNSGELTKEGDAVFRLQKPSASATAYLLVKASNWNDSISLTHQVTVNTKPVKGKFDVSKVTLNKNYSEAKLLKFTCGSSYEKLTFELKSVVDAKKKEYVDENGNNTSNIYITGKENGLLMEFRGSSKPETGKYTVTVIPKINDAELSAIKVNVQIVDTPASVASMSTKGKLDIVDRENTFLTVTPKFKNINGVLTEAEFMKGASVADKLDLSVEDGKIIIKLKPDEEITGAELKSGLSAQLSLIVTSDNGDRIAITSSPLKIKVTQSAVKAAVVPKSVVMYSKISQGTAQNIDFAISKPVGAEIASVTLASVKSSDATYNCFKISENSSGGYTLQLLDKGKELKAKTYNVAVNLKFKGSAMGSKQHTLKIKVVIKN
jgi:hypothetical protein